MDGYLRRALWSLTATTYLQQLDNNDHSHSSFRSGDDKVLHVTYAEVHADEIVDYFAADDPAVKEIAKKHARATDRIPELKKWLAAKIEKR